jgi:HEPN domain-containing protein
MLPINELEKLQKTRLDDAEALLEAGRFDGAIYLSGYSIEIALKARICKTLRWPAFPETNKEFEGLISFKTHDFNLLLRLSGVETLIKSNHLDDWSTVLTWKPELRYSKVGTTTYAKAKAFVDAVKTLLQSL